MRLLFGMWVFVGLVKFDREFEVLVIVVNCYGDVFVRFVDGILVGSEDLYWNLVLVEEGLNLGVNF